AAAMAAAAAPYLSWLNAATARAEGAAAGAKAAAAVYEAARAATAHPALVAANRNQLLSLVLSNLFGQNLPAIAATEASYEQLWAQDVAAMVGYHGGASTVASQLTPWQQLLSVLPPVVTAAPAGAVGVPAALAIPALGVENIGVGNFLGIGDIGNNNVGSGNTGDYNFGIGNIGNANLGNGNIGNANLGSGNAGFFNFGNGNDGNTNFGSGNAGFLNIGSGNEGSGNLGFGNAGDDNTGWGNSGDTNTGGFNSGDLNTGIGSPVTQGVANSGFGNTGTGHSGFFNSGNSGSGFQNLGNGSSGFGNASDTSSGFQNAGTALTRASSTWADSPRAWPIRAPSRLQVWRTRATTARECSIRVIISRVSSTGAPPQKKVGNSG
ncbi:PPE family protein, partial [Mycobacterium tuberculosis]